MHQYKVKKFFVKITIIKMIKKLIIMIIKKKEKMKINNFYFYFQLFLGLKNLFFF